MSQGKQFDVYPLFAFLMTAEVDKVSMFIRRYQKQDNETVKSLHYAGLDQCGADVGLREHSPYDDDLDNIETVYLENDGEFIVGILDDEIVAMGGYRKLSPIRAEIKRIRVRRDCQRQGYGETVLKKLLELAIATGYREVCLDTTTQNIPAQQLFEKCGFTETRRDKFDRFDIIYYEKKLTG